MKKLALLIALGVFFVAGEVMAKTQEMVKEVGDLKVKLIMDMMKQDGGNSHSSHEGQHNHSMGLNTVDIIVSDNEGTPVTDAKIKMNYSMPPMNNMPPMKYTARAKPNGEAYRSKLNFSMKGEWKLMLYIKRPGKSLEKVEFKVHVM